MSPVVLGANPRRHWLHAPGADPLYPACTLGAFLHTTLLCLRLSYLPPLYLLTLLPVLCCNDISHAYPIRSAAVLLTCYDAFRLRASSFPIHIPDLPFEQELPLALKLPPAPTFSPIDSISSIVSITSYGCYRQGSCRRVCRGKCPSF